MSDTPTFGRTSGLPDSDDPVVPRHSLLDDLRAEVKEDVRPEPITLVVPGRPGWAVRYSVEVDDRTFGSWRKRAADKTMPDGIDQAKLCATVLANMSEVFVKDGTDALDENSDPINFRSQYLLDMMGVGRALDAVKKWYGLDGQIISAGIEVLAGAGYGEDAMREDPTPRS